MFLFKIRMNECKHSDFTFWYFKIFCKVCFFNYGAFRWWIIITAIFRALWEKIIKEKKRFIRKDLCLKMDKQPYWSALRYGRKCEKVLKRYLNLKLRFIPKTWKRKAMAISAGKGTLLSTWKKSSNRKV